VFGTERKKETMSKTYQVEVCEKCVQVRGELVSVSEYQPIASVLNQFVQACEIESTNFNVVNTSA